ncbi:DNA-processing protein DprA [Joostella sp. CR20]|uniref:DNA-processing protein DprA n=1 Tax=Joostella sp. CR20 TaxID=2804312 RepID=UPI00313C7692
MTDKELLFLLTMHRAPKVGDITAKKLLQHCGCAEEVFKEKKRNLLKIDGIGEYIVDMLHQKNNFMEAEQELQFLRDNNYQVVSYYEEEYPRNLRHCVDGPILMFSRGNINFNHPQQKILSVVGTRQITSYGIAACEKFIEDISYFKPIILSGFAYGVDICAHKAAMKNGLQTIGVLAHGLNQMYPKTHAKYCSAMEENGGFISDFWSDEGPERNNFLKRNRIIAGMADATIVIESASKGGSLVTADIAASYNREVFAVPGRATDKFSEGCNNLIKTQQAHMLTSAADLVYVLGWNLEEEEKKSTSVQKQLFVDMNETEQAIYSYLQKQGKQLLDVIALDCKLPIHQISATLLTMEMKGLIRPLPGKLFEAV